jgi:hypothetical protein
MNLRVKAETATTVTLEWDPLLADGFIFFVDGQRKSHTLDGTRTTVKFSKPDSGPHTYVVSELTIRSRSEIVVPVVTPSPPSGFDPHTIGHVAPWNLDATKQPVDPNSAALIQTWVSRGMVKYPNVTTYRYSTAWAEGKASDSHYAVKVVKYGVRTITDVPIPAGTLPTPDSDGHLTIFDLEHGRQIAMWQAAFSSGVWQCGSASEKPLSQAGAVGAGANATGIPNFALAVWPEEIQAGRIDHALGFSTPAAARDVFRYPAVHTDGSGQAGDLPEGAWLRLRAGAFFDNGWPAWVKVIHAAHLKHGQLLMDQGGTLGIAGVSPINGGLSWSAVGMGTGGSVGFPSNYPWGEMEVLVPPQP